MRIFNFSFRHKLLSVFILYGLVLVSIAQFSLYKIHQSNFKTLSIEKASHQFNERENYFKFYINALDLKLKTIQQSHIVDTFFDPDNLNIDVESFFLDIAKTSDEIMQLRYIDNRGQEKIRIDREEYGSSPYLVVSEKLQNKQDRYYFKEIMKLKKDEFWYSKIDLNIEHGKIELPIKPVLRIGTPFYHKGEQVGILVINIFMKNFLKNITNIPLYNLFIVDKNGAIIAHPEHKNCWGKYLNKDETLGTFFPKDVKNILAHDEVLTDTLYSKKIFLDNGEEIRFILEPKAKNLKKEDEQRLYDFLYVMIGVILLSFPIAYLLARHPSRLKEEVDEMNETLEERVVEKTVELRELNDNLENKITERTQEQAVLLSLFDLSDAVLFKWNNDENWSVSSVSKSVNKLTGYSQDELLTHFVVYSNLIHSDDLEHVTQELDRAIKEHHYFFTHEPYRIITKDNQIKWILDNTVIVRDDNDTITNFVGYLTDITELKNSELMLKRLSQTDQLTQIYNRMQLDNLLQDQYYRFHRNSEKCSIILIDIDYFKRVNDEFGHIAGDMVLVEFAKLLQSHIRKGDSIGRWGGEEFLIILPHTDLNQAIALAEKLRSEIEVFNFSIVEHKTASFGVSTFKKGMNVEELIDASDKALYKSKTDGRNCVNSI
ncbi:MAG: diguanylate cyclase [Campylobacterota bacterium]|nr:diguanylate cyclase [Campylobacterota bacterium]